MLQRLKGAIDSRIAEEQARAKASGSPATPGLGRSSSQRNSDSPARRPRTRSKVTSVDNGERGIDPAEFEAAFVIEDEDGTPGSTTPATRTGTPKPGEKMEGGESSPPGASEGGMTVGGTPDRRTSPATTAQLTDLPADVRAKLRKLDKLEAKYHELLRSYRVAHARAVSIEPFEKTLRENTPLTTIKEPEAFVEYLSQLTLKGDMVMDELKRVTTDRDLYKKKFEQIDKEATEAQAKVVELEKNVETAKASTEKPTASRASLDEKSLPNSPEPIAANKSASKDKKEESFFSADDEAPQLRACLSEKDTEISSLRSSIKTLEQDLSASNQLREELSTKVSVLEADLSKAKEGQSAEVEEKKENLQELKKKLEITKKASEDLQKRLAEQENEKLDVVSQKVIESEKAAKEIELLKGKLSVLVMEQDKMRTDKIHDMQEVMLARTGMEARSRDIERVCGELNTSPEIEAMSKAIKELKARAEKSAAVVTPPTAVAEAPAPTSAAGGGKKKNKKKKKGGAAAAAAREAEAARSSAPSPEPTPPITAPAVLEAAQSSENLITPLKEELETLKKELADKDTTIERLVKHQDEAKRLREKVEELEENYMEVSNEHVEAKDQIKELKAIKKQLEEKIEALEATIQTQITNKEAQSKAEEELSTLKADSEELQYKLKSLQSDLDAAEDLASKRFKELSDLKDVLQKAQPELRQLRAESDSLRQVRDELTAKTSELKKIEARENTLKAEATTFKKRDRKSTRLNSSHWE